MAALVGGVGVGAAESRIAAASTLPRMQAQGVEGRAVPLAGPRVHSHPLVQEQLHKGRVVGLAGKVKGLLA